MAADVGDIEKRLWAVADQLRANGDLKPSEYSRPVLGLLFLRYAETRFAKIEAELQPKSGSRMGPPGPDAYKARGVIYLAPEARFSTLLALPDAADIGKALNDAMKAVEDHNPDLEDALPKNYGAMSNDIIRELIKLLAPVDIPGDAFGKVYEYFMGNFAMQEMQKGGEFYTPSSIVDLIVEIIEPYKGRILDPACGSGGMFVHSADFVRAHSHDPSKDLSVFGMEKVTETQRFARMNLAVHGLSGNIRVVNSFYEEPFPVVGEFDYVMANPPFNVDGIDKERDAVRKRGDRFPFGLPSNDNANYLWIQMFWSALNETGRAGFVMANSASDARGSEAEIRRKLVETGTVDVIVSVGPNFFYTVTLPCNLWFFDKAKVKTDRKDQVLFIDARSIFRQIDRAHRDFTEQQIEFIGNIVRLWREEDIEVNRGSHGLQVEYGFGTSYADIAGLCKAASLQEIAAQGWSFNPGRYVGSKAHDGADEDFVQRFRELNEELDRLNVEEVELSRIITMNSLAVLRQSQ